jgi:glucose-6-phosphate 1-dehydrogenase
MGATGNLAAKYLWNALYGLFLRQYSKDTVHFQIYAVSRSEPESARRKISRQLLSLVDCGVETADAVDSDCVHSKTKFIESISYQQLKTERDFKTLGEKLYENTQSVYGIEPGSPNTYESGRLIYMSIPPSTYAATAKYTDQYLRPKIGRPWFRVVIEKPFGHDINSAKQLAADLKQYFLETELYRIDHYLAKTVVKQILPFRYVVSILLLLTI